MTSSPSNTAINREAHARSSISAHPPSSPTLDAPEPREGDVLLEELEEPSSSSGSLQEGTKRKRVRRWKLVGDELGRGAFSSVWGARRVVQDEEQDGLDEDETDVLKEARKGLVAVKLM
jgi:hypothetical protein